MIANLRLYDDLLDALYETFGRHPGFRVAHAKGVLSTGNFIASAAARTLSTAFHLCGEAVPVVARFSNFSGLPATPDGDPMASPYGLALRFQLPDGTCTDIVAHSYDGFPVATPTEFLEFLLGIAASSGQPAMPYRLEKFLAEHAAAKDFMISPKPAPRSYASIPYFGVNSFVFIDADGGRRFGRYRVEPSINLPALTDVEIAEASPDYLSEELRTRLSSGAISLRLVLQLANPDDDISDGSVAWARIGALAHEEIELGELLLDGLPGSVEQRFWQRNLNFNPGRITAGIELSDDPMVAARQGIYDRAVKRRADAAGIEES
ncbi:catalase family peroxidase [Pseudomonas sp.]|uniref:catalase family peroxidase n=1 Tax=Pseudomonas sp. TaxID=306 RepID=UPI002487DFFD|nr:catalase family peroxidase [Pseudomonas sp.]MDI1329527.1 catalase family peroxidase [Pseudomonas sp.]